MYWGRWNAKQNDDADNWKERIAEVARSAVGSTYLTPIDQYRDIPSNEFGADINVFFTHTVDPKGELAPYTAEAYPCESEKFGGGNWLHYPTVLSLLPADWVLDSSSIVIIAGDTKVGVGGLPVTPPSTCEGATVCGSQPPTANGGPRVIEFPYPSGACSPAFNLLHEIAEAITDPDGVHGWRKRSIAAGEVADLCDKHSETARISREGGKYAIQPLWSNSASGGACFTPGSQDEGNTCCVFFRLTHGYQLAQSAGFVYQVALPLGHQGAYYPTAPGFTQDNPFIQWQLIGPPPFGQDRVADAGVAAVSMRRNRVDVFAKSRARPQSVLHAWSTNASSWSIGPDASYEYDWGDDWGAPPGCPYMLGLAAVSSKPDELEVYTTCDTGLPNNVWRRRCDGFTNTSSEWEPIVPTDGTFTLASGPGVAATADGVVHIYGRSGVNGSVAHAWGDVSVEDGASPKPVGWQAQSEDLFGALVAQTQYLAGDPAVAS